MVMQKRQAHNKSRKGCQNCKKRHVKCDEQGPPCANCIIRHTTDTCSYEIVRRKPRTTTRKTTGSQRTSSSPDSSNSNNQLSLSPISAPSPSSSISNSAPSPGAHMLELDLLHRWTTHTYKSLCSFNNDGAYLQVEAVRSGLQYPYLLNSLLAFSALDAASTSTTPSEADMYVRAALTHCDKASQEMRQQLGSITPANVHCVYLCSSMIASVQFAMPDGYWTPLTRTVVAFELMIGTVTIAVMHWDWFMASPFGSSTKKAVAIRTADFPLDGDAVEVLARLDRVVAAMIAMDNETRGSVVDEEEEDGVLEMVRDAPSAQKVKNIYRRAVKSLELCFKEDARQEIRAFCIAFPALTGQEYIAACKNQVPVALLILMHWAVLLDRLSDNEWWAVATGKGLIQDISEMLFYSLSPLALMTEWQEGVAWARDQVGLPLLI